MENLKKRKIQDMKKDIIYNKEKNNYEEVIKGGLGI